MPLERTTLQQGPGLSVPSRLGGPGPLSTDGNAPQKSKCSPEPCPCLEPPTQLASDSISFFPLFLSFFSLLLSSPITELLVSAKHYD